MTSKSGKAQRVLSRNSILGLINASNKAKSYKFARQVAQKWLELFPNDLYVQYLLAKSLIGEGKISNARELLIEILLKDPEFTEAYEVLAYVCKGSDNRLYKESLACVTSLGSKIVPDIKLPDWPQIVKSARQALNENAIDKAEAEILNVIGLNLDLALPAVTHIQIVDKKHDEVSTFQLARIYNSRWPKCVQFKLFLAHSLLKLQDDKNSLAYLNDCVRNDINGQVPKRIWGNNHQFSPLWPEKMSIDFQEQIPASVNSILGWNILEQGIDNKKNGVKASAENAKSLEEELLQSKSIFQEDKLENHGVPDKTGSSKQKSKVNEGEELNSTDFPGTSSDIVEGSPQGVSDLEENIIYNAEQKAAKNPNINENLRSVEQAFQKLAKKLNKPEIIKTDNRFPMCVLLSSKIGLKQQFGEQTTGVIEKEMRFLADQIRKRPGWGATLFFPDSKESTQGLGIKKIDKNEPEKIKQALVNLDSALSKKGAKIGAIIIIGGPTIVPYHKLPNPTDDADAFVYTDNPYATIDSNYFVHNWPVGRISGETGTDPGLLIFQIRNTVEYHRVFKRRVSWWNKIEITSNLVQLFGLLGETITRKSKYTGYSSFGYSASIWKDSSKAVFRVIGDPEKIKISPPLQSGGIKPEEILSPLGYFNLHGLEDSPSWYGQRDLTDTIPGPDYPVALTPNDLVKSDKKPRMIFSEACYGGNIINKKENDSIALKYMAIGAPVFVGSTGISYGSVTTPLIGADFLAYLFWYHLAAGYTAGEALLQARIDFVREMHTRQGFLDGEDQKTLLSFVLFGDPMSRMDESQEIKKFVPRNLTEEPINTICDICTNPAENSGVTKEILAEIKQIVEMYLPGMDEAEISVSHQHKFSKAEIFTNEHGEQIEKKSAQKVPTGKVIVSFKKHVKSVQQVHKHYAKATLDSNGKMVKLALSK